MKESCLDEQLSFLYRNYRLSPSAHVRPFCPYRCLLRRLTRRFHSRLFHSLHWAVMLLWHRTFRSLRWRRRSLHLLLALYLLLTLHLRLLLADLIVPVEDRAIYLIWLHSFWTVR